MTVIDGISVDTTPLGASTPQWTKYTVTHATFTASNEVDSVELFSLPVRGVIHEVVLKHSTSFTGGSINAFELEVGIGGETTKYAESFDVFQAPGDAVFDHTSVADSEDLGATKSIKVTATANSDDVVAADAGSCDIWVLTSVLQG